MKRRRPREACLLRQALWPVLAVSALERLAGPRGPREGPGGSGAHVCGGRRLRDAGRSGCDLLWGRGWGPGVWGAGADCWVGGTPGGRRELGCVPTAGPGGQEAGRKILADLIPEREQQPHGTPLEKSREAASCPRLSPASPGQTPSCSVMRRRAVGEQPPRSRWPVPSDPRSSVGHLLRGLGCAQGRISNGGQAAWKPVSPSLVTLAKNSWVGWLG